MDLFNPTNRIHDLHLDNQELNKQNRERCYENIFKHQNFVRQDEEEILNETMKFVEKNIEKVLLDSDADESGRDNDQWSDNYTILQHSYFSDPPPSIMVMKGNTNLSSFQRSLNPFCDAGPPAPPAHLYNSYNQRSSSPPKSPLWISLAQRGDFFQKPNKNIESSGYLVGCGGDVFEVQPSEQPNKDQKLFLKHPPPPLSSPVAITTIRKQVGAINFQSAPILRMKKTSRFNWILNEMILRKFPALMKIDLNNATELVNELEQRHQVMDGFQNSEQQPLDQQDGRSKYLQFTEKMFSDYLKICAFELKKLEQEIDELIDGFDSNINNHHPLLHNQISAIQNRICRETTDNAKQKWCSSSMNQMDLFVWNLFELHEKLSSLINHHQPLPSQSSAYNNIPITKMIDVWYQIVEQIKNDLVNGDHNFNGSVGIPGSDFYHQQRQEPDSRIGFMETNLDPQSQYYYPQQQPQAQVHPYSVNPYHQYNHLVVQGFGGGQFGSQSSSTMVTDSSNNNHGNQNNHKSIIMHLKLLWRMTRHIRTSLWIVFLIPKILPNAYKNQNPAIIGSDLSNKISTTSIDSSVNHQQSNGNTVWNNHHQLQH